MKLALAALAIALGACDVCPVDSVQDTKFADVATYHDQIVACANHGDCNDLCLRLFALTPDEQLHSCGISQLLASGAWVVVHYDQPETCAADDDSSTVIISGDDDGTYDGGDDPCDDGSCDPPPDDGSGDDGSTDDGSGDDGSGDDGSGDWLRVKQTPATSAGAHPAT
jgi:hypothetical protein